MSAHKAEETRVRTVCVKVAEVVDGGTKQEFYADLRNSLDLSRRAANKSASLCFAADVGLMSGEKCPKLYTYPHVASAFPGAASIAASIARAVETKYKQERLNIASGRKSLSSYRSFPWVLLSNKSVSTIQLVDHSDYMTARIKLLGGWWTVRLAGGSNYRQQVKAVRESLARDSICDSKIWVDRKHKAVIGISTRLPAVEGSAGKAVMNVSSTRDAFIVATKDRSETPFVITGDQVKHWVANRSRLYQRLRQDRKSGKPRRKLAPVFAAISNKWQARITSFVHESTSHIVKHAVRRKVGIIKLDLTVKSFLPSFPWYEFESKLKYKCQDVGIQCVVATQSVVNPDIQKPHIYFKFSPDTGRVKIGKTSLSTGKRHTPRPTDSPDRNLVILAIDNQPKTKLTQREKHFHSLFASHRLDSGEWFDGEPVIHWLREARWLGNAGNLSQIAQVLPVQVVALETPTSRAECERTLINESKRCSQMWLTGEDIATPGSTALAVVD